MRSGKLGHRLRVVVVAAVAAGVPAVLTAGGCSRETVSGDPTGTGLFTGYEIGNEQDRAEMREHRPGYRRYE